MSVTVALERVQTCCGGGQRGSRRLCGHCRLLGPYCRVVRAAAYRPTERLKYSTVFIDTKYACPERVLDVRCDFSDPPLACHRIDVWECDRPICTALIELRPVESSWPCPWCEQAVGTHRTAIWCLHANHKVAEGLGEPCPSRLSCARGPLHGCRQAADAGSSHGLRARPLGGLETQGRDVLTALARALDRLANCLD